MKTARTRHLRAAALAFALPLGATVAQAADALPSWNDGKTKLAMLAFVEKVTAKGGAVFVPPAARLGNMAELSQSRDVVHQPLDGDSSDVLRQREGVIACVQDVQVMQLQVMKCDVSRASQFRRHGSLDLKSEAGAAADNQQIEFGSGVGGPEEALMIFGADPARRILVQSDEFQRLLRPEVKSGVYPFNANLFGPQSS